MTEETSSLISTGVAVCSPASLVRWFMGRWRLFGFVVLDGTRDGRRVSCDAELQSQQFHIGFLCRLVVQYSVNLSVDQAVAFGRVEVGAVGTAIRLFHVVTSPFLPLPRGALVLTRCISCYTGSCPYVS